MPLALAILIALFLQARLAAAQVPPTPEDVREVAPLDVEVSATRSATKQKMRGFDQRRQQGRGTFLTREQIEKRAALKVSDLLVHVTGVKVRPDPYTHEVQVTMGRGLRECVPQFFIDGSPRTAAIVTEYRAEQVEAMEIYGRASIAPPGYRSGSCGSVMVWTLETLRPLDQEQ